MSTSKETGHLVNLENFDQMIVTVKGFGTAYNPSNPDITIPQLELILTNARATQSNLHVALQPYSAASDAREQAFKPLSPLVTRMLSALVATKTSAQTDETAKSLVHKIKGKKSSTAKTTDAVAAQDVQQAAPTEKSSTQLGFDDQLQNFDQFIKLLEITPQYAPNESELKLDAIKAYHGDLATKNHTVIETKVAVANARIARNEVFYKPLTGLVDTALDVKTYVKSLFGATSPQYRQISGLVFSHPKN
jgi:hypothetical protein